MGITLKIQQMTIDGLPYGCPECGTPEFTLDGNGVIDALASVWGNCWSGHSWEEQLIEIDDLKKICAARTGRVRAEDDDTFEITIGGSVLAGILHPDVNVDDLKRAGGVYWQRLIKPALRKQKRRAVAAVKRPVRNSVAAAKAAAIGAAWDLQTGGIEPDPDYTPEPINPCPACNGKGEHKIKTRIHTATRVRCAVCHGTGEID
ncbi:hypothetical protein ACH4UM_23805 [Streptomyces sp. NPDC020801]|uniref:hypothetical protein n=1 Tax=Streptomyces sp. NPDC020801 TaxID=3365093 RepID=UPI0037B58A99